ncbi:hypothetical protein HDIA_0769 [Hartmannibacter diazotrophicus]|uniref:Uncharacterized protein n=1 Tax=Hartmannibacter diazotrophicus TaxID=1482074 RepID=A0A2C9D238_9HYPH|nr:hypothetical protein [Hartmannibacter diazotrophicus]SON54310.1 hypothetical protein HDIA_0769 [Hartmannibacter diazotrophicus]
MTENSALVVGRGEVYFDRFRPGTRIGEGERYLGNTPGFAISRSVDAVSRKRSFRGQIVQRDSLAQTEIASATVAIDNIVTPNIAMWLASADGVGGQSGQGTVTETFMVRPGRFYQLGSSVFPQGVRHVNGPNLTLLLNGSAFDLETNLSVDLTDGRLFVLEAAADIVDGDEISATFEWRDSPAEKAIASVTEVVGAMRFISKNAYGHDYQYYFPYVAVTPSGQYDLKSDQWQQINLNVDIRRKSPSVDSIIYTKIAESGLTLDENYIIELGGVDLDEFQIAEDLLDTIINTYMPGADYGAPLTYP